MIDKTSEMELELKTMRTWDGVEKRLAPAPLYIKAKLIAYFTMLILGSCMLSGFYLGVKLVWELI